MLYEDEQEIINKRNQYKLHYSESNGWIIAAIVVVVIITGLVIMAF